MTDLIEALASRAFPAGQGSEDKIRTMTAVFKAIYVMIFAALIAALAIGFILGFYTAEKDCYQYLAWWKTVSDCEKCDGWNCAQVAAGYSMWNRINESGFKMP
jgi:hypothetical protein